MNNFFMAHLKQVNESYIKHAKCALGLSLELISLSMALVIHAIFPFLFEHTASDHIHNIASKLKSRRDCK